MSFIPGWNVGSFWSLPGRRTAVGISQCIFVEVVNLVRKILRAEGARKFRIYYYNSPKAREILGFYTRVLRFPYCYKCFTY